MSAAVMFFYATAGYSHHPAIQTEVNGRLLGAIKLAEAEQWARRNGCWFEWDDDPEGAEVQDDRGEWQQLPAVFCLMYQHNEEPGEPPNLLGSLSAITESDDNSERRNYRRVVEAELALEAMP